MDEPIVLKRKCQNPACGKDFLIRQPLKPGKYGVNCPICKTVNYFTVPAQQSRDTSVAPIKHDSQATSVIPAKHDSRETSVAPIKHDSQATSVIPAKHDSRDIATTTPKASDSNTAQTRTQVREHAVKERKVAATLTPLAISTGAWWRRKSLLLTQGQHLVGRKSKEMPSNLMVSDNTMSYRSVRISVTCQGEKFTTKLIVVEALNPVYLNNEEVKVGQTVGLAPGDRLILGSTLFQIK